MSLRNAWVRRRRDQIEVVCNGFSVRSRTDQYRTRRDSGQFDILAGIQWS
jgi:hypothetical protein